MSDLFPSNEILDDATYFAITLGAESSGSMWTATQTWWVGFADDDRRVELREISPVRADAMARAWEDFSQPFCVVNDDRGFVRWILSGGHALITEDQTRKHLPWEMKATSSVREGFVNGFTDLAKLPKSAFQKAPTPKLRMTVLKRDTHRCMICGQRPADDVNIQLQVHHIRPLAKGGVTTDRNLITLCHTCHAGLEPHCDYTLFGLVEKRLDNSDGQLTKRMLQRYITDVRNYRVALRSLLESRPRGAPSRAAPGRPRP